MDSPEEFIKEANLVLNAGGTFICSTPNKKRLSGAGHVNPFHPNELEYEEFKKIFQKYFIIKEEYQQSESINYFRYQELKCLISKSENRNNAFLFQRFERFVRKLFGKTFVPESYFHPDLDCLYSEDMNIEPLQRTENWHKTYIIVGTVL